MRRFVGPLSLALTASLSALPSQAAILYATGFESPSFVTGPIGGQGGWSVFGAPATAANVETAVVRTGAKAVGVNGSVAGQTGPYYAITLLNPVIDLSADLFITSSAVPSVEWQFASTGPSLTGFIGGIDVVGTTILAITAGFPVVGSFTLDTWHHLDVIMNFVTQKYDLKLDAVTIAAGVSFCGSNVGCTGAPVASFGDGFFDTFGGGRDFGYMDNFSIATPNAAPEPPSLAILIVALFGLALTRRRGRSNARAF